MSRDEVIEKLAALLDLTEEEVASNCIEIPGVGVFSGQPERGGKNYIVGFDGGYLFGLSAWSVDELAEKYRNGERTTSPV